MVVISRPPNVGSVISLSSLFQRFTRRSGANEHDDIVRSRLVVFLTKGTIRFTGGFEVWRFEGA
jgi:hypothetical protein